MGSLKFAIGLEPPFIRNPAGGLYNFFLCFPLPSCCWIGVPEVLPFSLPDFGQLAENLLQDVDLFTMGLC